MIYIYVPSAEIFPDLYRIINAILLCAVQLHQSCVRACMCMHVCACACVCVCVCVCVEHHQCYKYITVYTNCLCILYNVYKLVCIQFMTKALNTMHDVLCCTLIVSC